MSGTSAGARKGWETRRHEQKIYPKRINVRTKLEKKSPQIALRKEMKQKHDRAFKLALDLTRMEWHGAGYARKARMFRRADDAARAAKERYERFITESERRHTEIKRRAKH